MNTKTTLYLCNMFHISFFFIFICNFTFFHPLYVRYIYSLYCDISILIFLEKAGHVLLFIIRSAQQNPHILAHIQVIQDTYISILYLYHLSVLKNSIHTQHEAFLGSLCLLFLCTFNKT